MKVLIVEDDVKIASFLKKGLEEELFCVDLCDNGEDAIYLAKMNTYDVIILDIMIKGLQGDVVCQTLREQKITLPIIMLSAKSTISDKVSLLNLGADDYLTKPFNLEELLLRVNKLIDKNKKLQDKSSIGDNYQFGGHTVDFRAQEATLANGEKVALSKKETMLLKLLIENKNEVVAREKILQSVWGYNVYPTTRTIDNFILNFRKYFEEDSRNPRYFHSVRGVGYKYAE